MRVKFWLSASLLKRECAIDLQIGRNEEKLQQMGEYL